MDFLLRAAGDPARVAILAGSFNPVTVAHLALARAALTLVDEVVFVLPRAFPHKPYSEASFDQRMAMLYDAVSTGEPFSAAASAGGLFLDIARECREAYGGGVTLGILCGRDAAERAMTWDYGKPGAVAEMLGQFQFLVAARQGAYQPPPEWAGSIRLLELPGDFHQVSASLVRQRIALGQPWEHLVPEAIHERVQQIYRPIY